MGAEDVAVEEETHHLFADIPKQFCSHSTILPQLRC
jgi:hypothetical protein